ncbi:MAG: hypothetical protein AB1801_02445 [Chloroflexota bacterium]
MAQSKFLTNNATLHIQANGDVLIKRRRLLSGAGILAGLLLALFGLGLLISIFSSFSVGRLLIAAALLLSSYPVLRSAWQGLQQPNILIEKSAQRVSQQPALLGGGEARHWSCSQFAGVAVWRSGQIRVGRTTEDVYQAGLVLSEGQLLPLVEIPAKKRAKTAEILAAATGLGIVQIKQQ